VESQRKSTFEICKLTKSFVHDIEATDYPQKYPDTIQPNLVLRVGFSGKKSWTYDYKDSEGKRQTFTFANATKVAPGEARKRIRSLGEDTAGDKRTAKLEKINSARRTIRAYLEGDYWTNHLSRHKSGSGTKQRIVSIWRHFIDTDMSKAQGQ
jgi:hypothetical protein